jgi:sec-independent protein translocase protein TatA
MTHLLAIFSVPGLPEWIIIGAIGLLLFGKRLPEVGRSLGRGIVEFKKGLQGIDDDVAKADTSAQPRLPANAPAPELKPANPEYKFDPYTGKPLNPPTPTDSSRPSA